MTRTKLPSYEFSDHGRQGATIESLVKTRILSFEAIQEEKTWAAELLCLMSFLSASRSSNHTSTDGRRRRVRFPRSGILFGSLFLNSRFATHWLAQLATQWWLGRESLTETATQAVKALESLVIRLPGPYSNFYAEYLALCEILLPHAEPYQFCPPVGAVEIVQARLLNSTGRYVAWMGDHDNARSRLEQSLYLNSRHIGERHVDTMTSAALLGWLLAVYFKDPSAVPILERVLTTRQNILGANDPTTMDAASDISMAIGQAGDWPRAEAPLRIWKCRFLMTIP